MTVLQPHHQLAVIGMEQSNGAITPGTGNKLAKLINGYRAALGLGDCYFKLGLQLLYIPYSNLIGRTGDNIFRAAFGVSDFVDFLLEADIKCFGLEGVCVELVDDSFVGGDECDALDEIAYGGDLLVQSHLLDYLHVHQLHDPDEPLLADNQQVLTINLLDEFDTRYNNPLLGPHSHLLLTLYIYLRNIPILTRRITELVHLIKYQSMKFTHTICLY